MNAITVIDAPDRAAPLVACVRSALRDAILGQGSLGADVLALSGMSGRKYRLFINSLIGSLARPCYMEIGSWAGSTLCSVLSGNDVDALAIDNWSMFGGPYMKFFENVARFKGKARVSFLERDFRQVNYESLAASVGLFNVYLFDGPHEYQDQYDGVVLAQPCLTPTYIQIVDDWNLPDVRNGTMKAFTDLGLGIEFMSEIRTTQDDQHAPEPWGGDSDWHNGYCIAVASKPDA